MMIASGHTVRISASQHVKNNLTALNNDLTISKKQSRAELMKRFCDMVQIYSTAETVRTREESLKDALQFVRIVYLFCTCIIEFNYTFLGNDFYLFSYGLIWPLLVYSSRYTRSNR